MTVDLLLSDCLEVMATMEPCSVDAIVTDPPYGLRFMGHSWDRGVPGIPAWEAALSVAKPGCHMLAFGGTRTSHRLACAIEDAGWQIRDTIMWVYGSGFPKSHNLDGAWEGWGTALKPAWEPIILARKPIVGAVAANALEYGTGALNIDACRVPGTWDRSTPWRHDFRGGNFNAESAEYRTVTAEPQRSHKSGRWPANLIHDGSDAVTELFPKTKSGKQAPGGHVRNSDKTRNAYGAFVGMRCEGNVLYGDTGSAARFYYCAKASSADRDEGLDDARNHHPMVKPTDLMRYLVRLVTPPGGLILDPFMGSGSTGKAAVLEGFRFVGIDIDQEYIEIARQRIEHAGRQRRLPIVQ